LGVYEVYEVSISSIKGLSWLPVVDAISDVAAQAVIVKGFDAFPRRSISISCPLSYLHASKVLEERNVSFGLVASSRLCPLPGPLGMLVEMFQINREWYYLIIFPKPSSQLPPVKTAKVIRTKRRIVLVNYIYRLHIFAKLDADLLCGIRLLQFHILRQIVLRIRPSRPRCRNTLKLVKHKPQPNPALRVGSAFIHDLRYDPRGILCDPSRHRRVATGIAEERLQRLGIGQAPSEYERALSRKFDDRTEASPFVFGQLNIPFRRQASLELYNPDRLVHRAPDQLEFTGRQPLYEVPRSPSQNRRRRYQIGHVYVSVHYRPIEPDSGPLHDSSSCPI
jgi:hypothetical protein